LTLFKD